MNSCGLCQLLCRARGASRAGHRPIGHRSKGGKLTAGGENQKVVVLSKTLWAGLIPGRIATNESLR